MRRRRSWSVRQSDGGVGSGFLRWFGGASRLPLLSGGQGWRALNDRCLEGRGGPEQGDIWGRLRCGDEAESNGQAGQ